jgi:hypothetical protein
MVPSNALTVEEIINSFPNPGLHKINNEPTFEDIQVKTLLLNANAISVPSIAGGGARGHLGIIMTQVEYGAISATPWVEPFNHGAIPIIPPDTKAVDAAQIARMHYEFCRIYTNRINVDQGLKRIMIKYHVCVIALLVSLFCGHPFWVPLFMGALLKAGSTSIINPH